MWLQADIDQLKSNVITRVDTYITNIYHDCIRLTPVQTGKLKAGWSIRTTPNETIISNDVEYAPYVNYGTPKMDPVNMIDRAILGNRL